MTLYTQQVRSYVRGRKFPTGFIFEIIEYPEYLAIRMFRDNFDSFDGEDRLRIAMSVKEIMENIRKSGIPIYMEVEKGNGRS